ncbi:MAG: ATP-binding protein, partial [Candidatus Margulisiibacteriota bacterium]
KGDFSFKVVPNSNDEIADVINYFNSMSEEIKRARDVLENWNRELEIKVKERTEDLQVLYEISKAMGSSLDLDLLVRRALEQLMPIMQTQAYALLLPDEKRKLSARICFACKPQDFEGGETPLGWTAVNLRAKGEIQGVLMLKIPELDERKSNLLATLSDQLAVALENVSVYEKEKEAVAQLTELDRMKNEFISMVSHELRTPVTSVDGYVSLFLSGVVGPLTEDQKKYLAIVKDNNHRLLALIDRLLDFSKIESGRFALKRELVSMHAVIQSAFEIMRPQIEKKKANLKLKLEAHNDNFMGDYDKMSNVLINLIENALKFSKEEEPLVIEVSTRDAGDFIEVAVADNGIGIEKEYLEKVFNKFFQIEDTMTRRVGGVGLGLAIAKEIVGNHQGKIWAESEGKGKGARFIFTIPVAEKV